MLEYIIDRLGNIDWARKFSLASLLLAASMFFTGGCGLVAEYILSTVSTYILGNSIEQMSITICTMMLFMGIGMWAQQFVSDRNLTEKFIDIELALAWLIGFAPLGLYSAFAYLADSFVIIQWILMSLMGFLIGFEIPLVMRLYNHYVNNDLKQNLSNTISWDYIGAFGFGIIWAYVLLKKFSLPDIGFMIATINLVVAALTFGYFSRYCTAWNRLKITILFICTFAGLSFGFVHSNNWAVHLQQRLYEDPIIFSHTSRYQHLVMTYNRKLDEYRFYINGNLQFSSSDEAIYHEQLVHPVMNLVPVHKRVLILGGGDGLALREVLKYQDVESVTLVDLDPDMVKICADNPALRHLNKDAFKDSRVSTKLALAVSSVGERSIWQETDKIGSDDDPRTTRVATVNVLHLDADRFLQDVGDYWDVVIVDFPDPNSIELAKLYSREFYAKLTNRLSAHGMIVVQATSPYHAKESFLCVLQTMEAASLSTLPYHDNVPSFGDWGFLLGWKASIPDAVVDQRIDQLDIAAPTRYLTAAQFRAAQVFGKGMLEPAYQEINTLMNPVLLTRYRDDGWKIE